MWINEDLIYQMSEYGTQTVTCTRCGQLVVGFKQNSPFALEQGSRLEMFLNSGCMYEKIKLGGEGCLGSFSDSDMVPQDVRDTWKVDCQDMLVARSY